MLQRIVCLDSAASIAMATRVAAHVRSKIGDVQILPYKQLLADLSAHSCDKGATLVVAAALASGRSLVAVSRVLRTIQKNGAINYLIGVSRLPSRAAAREVESNVRYGEHHNDHDFFVIEQVYLPLSGHRDESSCWASELSMLNDLIDRAEGDVKHSPSE